MPYHFTHCITDNKPAISWKWLQDIGTVIDCLAKYESLFQAATQSTYISN